MKAEPPVIIKIGGSVLTDKQRSDEIVFRDDVIERVAGEIGDLYSDGYRMVIVHGAGSAGHIPVKKYKLYAGIREPGQLIKLTYTQNRVNELRQRLLNAFEKSGVPAVMFYPSSIVVARRGRIVRFFADAVKRYYEVGFVPVLSGDMVADEDDELKLSVCSGDQLVFELAKIFGSRRIVFGVDVDGVYENFGKPDQRVVERITLSEARELIESVGTGARIDVTGGMRGKLGEALKHPEFFESGGEVWILNLLKPGVLVRALVDGSGTFTRIVKG